MVAHQRVSGPHHPFLKLLLTGIASVSLICCLFFIGRFVITQKRMTTRLHEQSAAKTHETAANMAQFMSNIEQMVQEVASAIDQHQNNPAIITDILKKKPKEISGLGFIDTQSDTATYYVELEGKQTLKTFQASTLVISDGLQTIQDPITQQKTLLIAKKSSGGITFATLSFAHIRHILSTLYLGQSGYWFLVDLQGTLLAHPNGAWVNKAKKIGDQELDNPSLKAAFTKVLSDTKTFAQYNNEITGAPSWLFIEQVATAPLYVAGVFDKNELPLEADFYRHSWFSILISIMIAAIALLFIWPLRVQNPSNNLLWVISSMIAGTLLVSIAAAWLIATKYPYYKELGIAIKDKTQLYGMLDAFELKKKNKKAPELIDITNKDSFAQLLSFRYKKGGYVPTGIMTNDLKFISQDQVEFVGYIWQRYFDGIHDGLSRGFILPQIASKPTIIELSRTKIEKAEIIIWQVQAILNQDFNYDGYPFDVKDIQIQVRHKDFSKQVVLVPDLDAYSIINPTALPGISADVHVTNWHLIKSYFEYKMPKDLTNYGLYAYGPFGIYQEVEQTNAPELHLSVVAQRTILDTIITDLLALCVIAVILFVLLLTYFSEGFDLLLETCGAAFFSTVFAQIQFRAKIPTHGFVYFEIFYFTLYLAIMLILVSTLIHLFHSRVAFINYRKNILTKLAYWPFILTIIFITTIIYLY